MARPFEQFPPLRWLKACKRWGIYWRGERKAFHADRSQAETMRLAFLEDHSTKPIPARGLTLSQALAAYVQHARKKYARDTAMLGRVERVVPIATAIHGHILADEFRGRALRDVRDKLLAEVPALSRRYINHLIASLKAAFSWLVEEELCEGATLAALRAVKQLTAGHGGEERPIPPPVDLATVKATLPHLSKPVAAMVQIQMLTGMRPGEVCIMRRCDISRNPLESLPIPGSARAVAALETGGKVIWQYVPSRHKNAYRGKPRVVPLGPQAQVILAPFLVAREPHEYLFRPVDAFVGRRGLTMIRPGPRYSAASYSRSVAHAITRHSLEHWNIYQLRRLAAEAAALAFDADHAGAFIGHAASVRALDCYAQIATEKAATVAAKCG